MTISGFIQRKVNLSKVILIVAVSCAAFGVYLLMSSRLNGNGFPLDDAWIHQTYARNLAWLGQWAFIPGQPSAGSTSPLWSVLLSLGYLIRLQPLIWAYTLGGASLCGVAILGEKWYQSYFFSRFPYMGLFLIGEWHLVWAAVSGMETLLYSFLILAVFYLLFRQKSRFWIIGAVVGLTAWVRPDGITLLGPVFFVVLLTVGNLKGRSLKAGECLIGFLVVFLPYLYFNWLLAGNWWPNTFYAKQAEYAIYQQIPYLQRYLSLASLPLIGAGAFLLPGFFYQAWSAVKSRDFVSISAVLWWAGYTGIYASRLPVTYQHGRYLIPAMPVYFIVGLIGVTKITQRVRSTITWQRVFKRAWIMIIVGIWLGFYGIGAQAYAQDVAIINTEMVASAKWISKNTPPTALIAAHDIGALGYFGGRKIIDLAGLVSPEVIPFIRDEVKLANYLDNQHVDYLETFPNWYPSLSKLGTQIFDTHGKYSLTEGGENMHIYRWRGE
ncbi:MAG: hypothetical protein P4L50_12930 [Anaerolineaceae bacterium]|nr:hypothetical protein [Anaerolineaceae bacterium]